MRGHLRSDNNKLLWSVRSFGEESENEIHVHMHFFSGEGG